MQKARCVSTHALLAKYVLTYWQVCKVGTAVPCLPSLKSQSVHTPAVLAILRFLIMASAISLNGNRRQPPPCLPKSETDGRCQWRRSRSSGPLTAVGCFATRIEKNDML